MNYRQFTTSTSLKVIAGKNASQNDEIVRTARRGDIILHTVARGSPFCIIKAKKIKGKIDSQSIKEAAVFCAAFSKAWKQKKKVIAIHAFKPEDTYKNKVMQTGTYGVKKIAKRLKVKPALAIGIKNRKLQCSPQSALDKIHIKITQGNLKKDKAAEKILEALKKKNIKANKERIMQLIPSGGFSIK